MLCNDGRCKKVRCGEDRHPMHRKIVNYDKVWRDFQYTFWPLMVILVITFVAASWDENIPRSSKIADIAGILGLFFSVYVAVWAFGTEQRRRNHEKEENVYYKINLNDAIAALTSWLNFIFKWTEPWQLNQTVRNAFCQTIILDLQDNRNAVLSICSEIQIMNLNPHVHADIKDQVYLIMVQARKSVSSTPTVAGLPSYYGVVNDAFSRMQKLLESQYMKDIDRLREEFGNDVVLNLNT